MHPEFKNFDVIPAKLLDVRFKDFLIHQRLLIAVFSELLSTLAFFIRTYTHVKKSKELNFPYAFVDLDVK